MTGANLLNVSFRFSRFISVPKPSLNVTKPEIDNDLMSVKPNSSWPHTEGGRAEFDALVQVKI